MYQCSIMSNSETIQLTWHVTLPGMMPVNITYDNTSVLNTADTDLGYNITTTLMNITVDMFIQSSIVFTVLRDVDLNQTVVECSSEDLDSSIIPLVVSISGRDSS